METTTPAPLPQHLQNLLDRLRAVLAAKPHPTSCKFYELLLRAAELHERKQRDYGTSTDPFANVRASEAFGISAWRGVAIRMNDKWTRVKTYCQTGKLANEGVEDSFMDLSVYSLIALVLFQEEKESTCLPPPQ